MLHRRAAIMYESDMLSQSFVKCRATALVVQQCSTRCLVHLAELRIAMQGAQDYTASMMCAFGGYAAVPTGLFSGCGDTVPRTVFTGRG